MITLVCGSDFDNHEPELVMFDRIELPVCFIALLVPFSSVWADPRVEVVTQDEIELIPLNPKRGDASPKAGVLWGDIRMNVPTGTLIQFNDGFSSPPHIHNITYRAVVIEGMVHNDDPEAENLWMEPGSFWTQPAGEVHITSASDTGATAFLEILSGPYLVQPSVEAFDNGERPINIEARNVIWLDGSDLTWIEEDASETGGASIAFLWGKHIDGQRNGTFIRFPAGYVGNIHTGGTEFKAITTKGVVSHTVSELSEEKTLEPGSYFGSEGDVAHEVECAAEAECQLYVHSLGKYKLTAPD